VVLSLQTLLQHDNTEIKVIGGVERNEAG